MLEVKIKENEYNDIKCAKKVSVKIMNLKIYFLSSKINKSNILLEWAIFSWYFIEMHFMNGCENKHWINILDQTTLWTLSTQCKIKIKQRSKIIAAFKIFIIW